MSAFYLIGPTSFQSVWYWILTLIIWTIVTHRTLGVPYDMILRARRVPEMVTQVEFLTRINVARLCGVYHAVGLPLAALVGFALVVLFFLGFIIDSELAKATFLLAAPLTVIAYSSLRMALDIEEKGHQGKRLVRILARRRFWHQVIAVVAILLALAVASASEPRVFAP